MIMQATTLVKAAEDEGVNFYDDKIDGICLSCVAEYLKWHWPSHEPQPTSDGYWLALAKIAVVIVDVKIKDDDEGMTSSSSDLVPSQEGEPDLAPAFLPAQLKPARARRTRAAAARK
jgi:hypothetical protein